MDGKQQRRPTVAVAVPSYNHASFVERSLRSIFAQTLPPTQLLVIDDGSTDGSAEVCERVLRDAPFPAELVVRPNRGLSATLNEALARTSSDYFAYLGSDDLWLPGFLKARLCMLEERLDAVLAHGPFFFIDAHDRILDCTLYSGPQKLDRVIS